jgi:FAD/FMN-containing dehydrogenase
MLNTETIERDARALAAAITGDIVAPGDAEYDLARRAWTLLADQRPALVAFPTDATDVVDIVAYARRAGLKVAPQGTGHNGIALPSLADTILVSTQRMRGVDVDVEAQTARVAAGTLWIEVTEATTPHGLFPLSGSSPDVGVVGYTVGGGLSWLARKHGLAANHVTAIELVTPEGELVRATAEEHADLFWAVRGGGGNFGVVTALEFRLFPYGTVYGGMMLFPYERHAEILAAWAAWTDAAPDEVTTSFRILHLPPLPELPPFLQGRSVVVIDGAYAGDAEAGAAAIGALRALGPELDTFAPSTPAALSRIHMDPEEPMPGLTETAILSGLDEAGLATFAGTVKPGAPIMFGELRQLGGALEHAPEGAGAKGSVPGKFLAFAAGAVMVPEMAPPLRGALAGFAEALAPYATGTHYLNFVEHRTDAAQLYEAADYARLRALRAAVDPDGVMVGNHPIEASA